VQLIARRLGVTEWDVVDMNRRLGGDVSLNAPIRDERNAGEWQDSLVDEVTDSVSVSLVRIISGDLGESVRPCVNDGMAITSSMPAMMRSLSSCFDATRMWRRTDRANLEKKPSMRLSQEPCVGVKVNSKRPVGRVASQALVSLEMCAE